VKLIDTDETVVLVTGTSLTAEERDRPIAYSLKAEIDRRGVGHAYRRAVVVGDRWYLENRVFHLNPTITVGGPGANAVTAELADAIPAVLSLDDRVFIQADFDADVKRASLWGADARATAAAVEAFVGRGLLDDLLGRIWKFRVGTLV
jgi:hypothetical protein